MMAGSRLDGCPHPRFGGAGAAYVVARKPNLGVTAAQGGFCGFRAGQIDRPGAGRGAFNCVRSCPDRQSDGVLSLCTQIDDMSTSILTIADRGRKVTPINGKNPLWGPSNSLFKTVSRHVSYGYFCAWIPGAILRLRREGGEYKTLRGNKPACLLTGLKPPATSAVLQSFVGGLFNSHKEGFDMTKHDSARDLPATLTFQNTELSIIDRDGVPWLTSADLARALGFADPRKLSNMFNRHKDEFTDDMAHVLKLRTGRQAAPASVRIFSPRGAQLIAMLAKTPRAKDFRRWVLDVLEGLAPAPGNMADDADLRRKIVAEVTQQVMASITPHLPVAPAPQPALPLARGDLPRLTEGQALFMIEGRQVIVDTRDAEPERGERAVVIRVEDGAGPIVVTILGDPPIKTWFDRCKIYDSGVKWLIPVGVVIGRVVWEGDYRG